MEGLSLLLLFLILWLVDRLLNAAMRHLRSQRALAEALKRGDAAVEIRQMGAPEEQQGTTTQP